MQRRVRVLISKTRIALTDLIQRSGLFYKLLSPTPYTGNVWGQKTGYLKNGRWDGDYVEVSPTKGFTLRGSIETAFGLVNGTS